MLRKSYMYLATIALAGIFSTAACGDDDDTTGSGGSGGSSTTTTTTGGMGGGLTCQTACEAVYACGVENNSALCPGWGDGMDQVSEQAWLNGSMMDGCLAGCADQPILINLVDPDNCAMTIAGIKGANPAAAESCDNGLSGSGGGGGAGGN